jgi:hypothetical protein
VPFTSVSSGRTLSDAIRSASQDSGAGSSTNDLRREPELDGTKNYQPPLWCSTIHNHQDNTGDVVGQPLCVDCYDYLGHVLFTWWAPELWRRFTIAVRRALRHALRRRGEDPDAVAVSFVKVVELQARAIPTTTR